VSESKITASQLRRPAVIYVRQSTLAQVQRNTESTMRQYDLVARAQTLGWPRSAVRVIDEDLGVSGASAAGRSGFAQLAAEVGLGQVGIVLSLECSRLARNNTDWYRLLDLAGMTDTLIADADGVYHPALFNDRLLLGMKGTMSEAELHILRARLDGGIRNKAARGELRRGLPVGLVWGEADGEILNHPDEAVTGVISAIFDRFAVCGSVRGTWLWLRDQALKFPLQPGAYVRGPELIWTEPTYHAVHNVLTHPAYAGAYTFGRSRQERRVSDGGVLRVRRRVLPQGEWEVLIKDHHPGFIDWDTYQANQDKIRQNIRPMAHQPGTGAVREGCALLQGLATCGTCGRKLAVYYDGEHKATPGYYCTGTGQLVEGRGTRHLRVGGVAIDTAVTEAFLAALQPAALQACLEAARQLEEGHDAALAQARYHAARAERRYQAVDPDNRLVARGLENAWEKALTELAAAEAELARRQAARPKTLSAEERAAILSLGDDLGQVWDAHATTDKDRKQLLRTLLDEVNITIRRDHDAGHADLVLRWKGGAISELTIPVKRKPPRRLRTSEDTISLVRRLAVHYPTRRSPGSSTGSTAPLPGDCRSPPVESSRCATTGTSPATKTPATPPPKETCSTWPRPPANLGSPPPRCCAGLTTASSSASRSPPAHPGRSASPASCAPCSPTTPPTAGSPSPTPPKRSASPARPYCRRSSAASCMPYSPAPDAGKACVSSYQPPKTACSNQHNQQRSSMTMHPSRPGCRPPAPTHSRGWRSTGSRRSRRARGGSGGTRMSTAGSPPQRWVRARA
jgi:DNA invertase Pin-like site-specific DNA recombinase